MHRAATIAPSQPPIDAVRVPPSGLSRPVPLAREHVLEGFTCGDAVIDEWLRRRALRRDSRASRTFATCDGDRVVGFYCIAVGLVAPSEQEPTRPRGRSAAAQAVVRDPVPVAVLRRLAVDRAHQGNGIGADLLMDALQRAVVTGGDLGVRAVLARAIEPEARAFYGAFGFAPFVDDTETLFLPIETAEAALRAG